MTRTLFTVSLFAGVAGLTGLAGSALADAQPTYRIDLVYPATQAKHTLYVTDHGCGELLQKTAKRDSFIKVCAKTTDDKRVRLEVDRRVRDEADEQSTQVTLITASGASFEVLDAKLTLKTQ